MYASRSTVVLYDVWILNPYQVAITVNCGHKQITNRQEHQTHTDDIHMRPHTV